jgi:vacuolar-type H+-ATPase subunit E/Vma4
MIKTPTCPDKLYTNNILLTMKKLFLSMAVLASLSMVSCGGSDKAAEGEAAEGEAVEAVDESSEAIPEVSALAEKAASVASSEEAQSLVTEVKDYVNKLIEEGRVDEAKQYLETVKSALAEKYPEVTSKIDQIDQIIGAASSATVEGAKDAAKQAAENVADDAKAKADEAVQNAKDKANESANAAVDKATDKANSAVNNAADKVKNKLKL